MWDHVSQNRSLYQECGSGHRDKRDEMGGIMKLKMRRWRHVRVFGTVGVALALVVVPMAEAASACPKPGFTTTPSPGGAVGVVVLNDTATLFHGRKPTGTITFRLYNPAHPHCGGAPA